MKQSLYRIEASSPFGKLTLAVRSNEIDIASDALQAATLGRCHTGMVRVKACKRIRSLPKDAEPLRLFVAFDGKPWAWLVDRQ